MRVGRTRYVSPGEQHCNESLCRIIMGIVLLGLVVALFASELEWRSKNEAFGEARGNVMTLQDTYIPKDAAGKLVFLTTHNVEAGSRVDSAFNFEAVGALKMKRVTEYCQWIEHSTTSEDSEGNKHVTYSYTLGWRTTRIPSLFFDQPFRHNNPQRDPYPSLEWVAPSVGIGKYTMVQKLVDRVSGYQDIYYPREKVSTFMGSEAMSVHAFKPIGNGYFYSPYQESTGSLVGRLAGMFLEGSLDIQLGDFFASCTAGDIRVHYEQIAPSKVSIIGKLLDAHGTLDLYQAKSGYNIGLVQSGIASNEDEMFDKDLSEHMRFLALARFGISFVFGLILVFLLTPPSPPPDPAAPHIPPPKPPRRPLFDIFIEAAFWGSVLFSLTYLGIHGVGNLILSLQHFPLVAGGSLAFVGFIWYRHFVKKDVVVDYNSFLGRAKQQ